MYVYIKRIKGDSGKMASVMNLINSFDKNTKEYGPFLLNLLSANCDIPFDKDEINTIHNTIITTVNIKLNQASTRYDGLDMLLRILPKCSKDVLTRYAILWFSKGILTLECAQCCSQELTLACKVIGCLVIRCKEIPELQKQVSSQNVKQLVTHIVNLKLNKRCGAVLYLIAILLHHYPEPCERFQTLIRKMILSLVDSTKENLVNAGANCYALLTHATARSFKPPLTKSTYTNWIYNQSLICNSLHEIMDDLFTGLIDLESIEIWDKLTLPNVPQDNIIDYYYGLERRFINLCVYLSTMLKGYGDKTSTSPGNILQLLCRGLAITPFNLKNDDSIRKQILFFILPKLHIGLLNVLDALIDGFRQELVPYALTILQLYQQTLKWTERVSINWSTLSGSKPFRNVRISIYKSLSTWLMCTGTLSGIEMVIDEYLPHILKDITPEKDRLLLTIQKTQNLSKRALKRFRDNQYENSVSLGDATETISNHYLDPDLCKEALFTLQNVFFCASCCLKQSFHKSVQNSMVVLLYNFYLGSSDRSFYKENVDCRLHLLRTLNALQMNPHPSTPPPTQYSIEIFNLALNDANLNIIQEARLALAELEKIVHPSAPTLQLPVLNNDAENEQETEVGQITSRESNEVASERQKNIWIQFKDQNESTVVNCEKTFVIDSNGLNKCNDNDAKSCVIDLENDIGPTRNKQRKINETEPNRPVSVIEKELSILRSDTDETKSVSVKTFKGQMCLDKVEVSSKSIVQLDESNETLRNIANKNDNEVSKRISEIADKDTQFTSEMIQIVDSSSNTMDEYFTSREIQVSQSPIREENNISRGKCTNVLVNELSNLDQDTESHKTACVEEEVQTVEENVNVEEILKLFCDELKEKN